MNCRDIGQWFTDNVEQWVNQWRASADQQCTQAQHWLEQVEQDLQSWLHTQQQRCSEQECNWGCLCCNKWFCWLIDVLVQVITVVITTIDHVIAAICHLIVTLIWVLASIIVQVVKWAVLAIVCGLEALCGLLILVGALALLVVLLAIVAQGVPAWAAIAAPWIPIALPVAVAALVLARSLCDASRCRAFGAIGWALKWAIVAGAVIAVVMLSPLSALIVVIFGGLIAALIVAIERIPCTLPRMLGLP
jgi:hypothetical protein